MVEKLANVETAYIKNKKKKEEKRNPRRNRIYVRINKLIKTKTKREDHHIQWSLFTYDKEKKKREVKPRKKQLPS